MSWFQAEKGRTNSRFGRLRRLIRAGYASHPSCYLGTGFCELPALDWVRIINTIDFRDVDFALMSEIGRECSGN